MTKRFLFLAPLLALGGCTGLPGLVPPVPVQQAACTADNELETAWKAFDVALDAINVLGDQGVIVPGTPKGKAIAAGIRRVNGALALAERFAATCSTGQASTALAEATAGMADISNALKGS